MSKNKGEFREIKLSEYSNHIRMIFAAASRDCKQDRKYHDKRHLVPVRLAVDEGPVLGTDQGLDFHEVAVAALLAHDAVCEHAAGFDVKASVLAGNVFDEPVSSVGEIG